MTMRGGILRRSSRRHRPGGLRHRPAQPLRHRHRPVHEPVHARQQRQPGGRLGHPRQPPDPRCATTATRSTTPTSPTRSCRRWASSAAAPARARCSCKTERWPEKYRNVLLTGDWGRSEVYRHELRQSGPTFALKQEVFLKIPRPTGMDMDGSGRLYVASWHGGEASNYVGPNVGFIARLTPRGLKPMTVPQPERRPTSPELVRLLAGPNSVARLHSQRRNPAARPERRGDQGTGQSWHRTPGARWKDGPRPFSP